MSFSHVTRMSILQVLGKGTELRNRRLPHRAGLKENNVLGGKTRGAPTPPSSATFAVKQFVVTRAQYALKIAMYDHRMQNMI
jgi:hypothetical protein